MFSDNILCFKSKGWYIIIKSKNHNHNQLYKFQSPDVSFTEIYDNRQVIELQLYHGLMNPS